MRSIWIILIYGRLRLAKMPGNFAHIIKHHSWLHVPDGWDEPILCTLCNVQIPDDSELDWKLAEELAKKS